MLRGLAAMSHWLRSWQVVQPEAMIAATSRVRGHWLSSWQVCQLGRSLASISSFAHGTCVERMGTDRQIHVGTGCSEDGRERGALRQSACPA